MLYISKKVKNVNKDRFNRNYVKSIKSIEKKRTIVKPTIVDNIIEPEKIEPQFVYEEEKKETKKSGKKNKKENEDKMDENRLKQVEELVNTLSGIDPNRIKRVKNDRGLIERTESSKIVLTEDNRQILND